jgi:hypothetical protein
LGLSKLIGRNGSKRADFYANSVGPLICIKIAAKSRLL